MQRQEHIHTDKPANETTPKKDANLFQIRLTPTMRARLEHAEALLRSEHGLKVKRPQLIRIALEEGLAHPEHLALALKTGHIQEFMEFEDEEEI
jgi:hypothetical protein